MDKEWRIGSENNPKAGTDETFRNFIVSRDTGSTRVPGTERTASWETHATPDTCTSITTSSRKPRQIKRQLILVVIVNTTSGIHQHASDQAQAQTNSRSQPQTVMGAKVPVVPTSTVLPTPTPKALIRSPTPTKRAAGPTTLDVPPQAKHARGEGRNIWN